MVRSRGLLWKAPSGMEVMSLLWKPLQEQSDGRALAESDSWAAKSITKRKSSAQVRNRQEHGKKDMLLLHMSPNPLILLSRSVSVTCETRAVYSQFLQFGQGLHRSGKHHQAVEVKISEIRRRERTDVRAALSCFLSSHIFRLFFNNKPGW